MANYLRTKFILQQLQELQSQYIDSIDIDVAIRKDQGGIGIRYCAYEYDFDNDDFINTSKLYSHLIKFDIDDESLYTELKNIQNQLSILYNQYILKLTEHDISIDR